MYGMSWRGEGYDQEELRGVPVHVERFQGSLWFALLGQHYVAVDSLPMEDMILIAISPAKVKMGPHEQGYDPGNVNDALYVPKRILHAGSVVGSASRPSQMP